MSKDPNANTIRSKTLESLIRDLKVVGSRDLAHATTLPPGAYSSEDFLDLELERLFCSEWICIGRTEEIPSHGDFISLDIADQPVIAFRQKDGSIRAFANTCLHRCSKLIAENRGHRTRFSCPYHAWTYDAAGTLLAAPYMNKTPGFSIEGKRLAELKVDLWEGFVYVSLDPNIDYRVSERLGELADVYARFRMEDYITFVHDDEIWDTNWKILVENFIEGYHLFRIHPESFEPISPTAWQIPHPGHDAFTYSTSKVRPESDFGIAPETNKHLEGEWRSTGSVGCVFPAHLIQITPDFLWYMSLQPKGVGQVSVRRGLAVAPERLEPVEDHEKFYQETKAIFDQVNAEDKVALEAVYAGAKNRFAESSPMSIHETTLYDFGRYLGRRITG